MIAAGSSTIGDGGAAVRACEGIVACADCNKAQDSRGNRYYCVVFSMVMPRDEKRMCTAFRPKYAHETE